MLVNATQQITISGVSAKKDPGDANTAVPIVYMGANIQENGLFSINQSVQDKALYYENMAEVKKDYDDFYDKVVEIARGLKTGEE